MVLTASYLTLKEIAMRKMLLFLSPIGVLIATLGFTSSASASTVALCVGCTTNSQFVGAAWQAFGSGYTQGTDVLVVDPGTGLSKWVYLHTFHRACR